MLACFAGQAQTLSGHNWYFGNGPRGLKFNRVTHAGSVVNNKANPFGTGGSSVASDKDNANLLFYTDGSKVFDISHTAMPNGTGLNGNTAGNQPTAICGIPGQPGKYYIFTNTANYPTGGAISFTVVDMNLFGNAGFPSPAFGDVDVTKKNIAITFSAPRAEGMITVPHANGNDFWLITQELNSQNFSATYIDATSFSTGTFTTVDFVGVAGLPTSAAHLGYNEVLRKIAVAPQDPSTDAIILGFNPTSGAISFDRRIVNSGYAATGNQDIYDIEWSPSGQYLYLSRYGETGFPANIFQYDYTNSTITQAPVLPAASAVRSYGLQRAPDNFIYHLYQAASGGAFLLGRINKPDTVAPAVNYDPSPFGALDFNGMQFPSFLPVDTVDLTLSFTTAGSCANSPTAFFPEVSPGADSLFWDFGDGSFARGWGPIHTYTAGGAYNARLFAFYGGQLDSAIQTVSINDFPLQIQMTTDTTACHCEFPPPISNAPGNGKTLFSVKATVQGGTPTSIVWSNGDTGDTIRPDSAGYYYVIITDASGCSGYAGVNVREYGAQDQIYNKWYFGNKAGIDFTPHVPSTPTDDCMPDPTSATSPPLALNESAMIAPEGCAIVCDRNGETIFYTDGSTVYDQTHTVIDTNIGGNPASTQSALIVAVPGDETLYYIFTTQAINGTDSLQLSYSLFDLKQNAGNGRVIKKSVLLFSKCTERITANGQWLVVHEYGNSTFRSYPISTTGIGDVVYTSIGSDHSLTSKENGEGYMKLGPGNTLAVPLSTPGTGNHIELFHLNDTTGTLSNYRDINLNEPAGHIYGLEFSPGGNKLFATHRAGGSSSIFEYSIDSLGLPHFKQRLPVTADLGAIQTGPDGQVYVATNDAAHNTSLGTILPNEDTTATSGFNLAGFALAAGTNSNLGLPNFVQPNSSASGGPDILVAGTCTGDSTEITGVPTDQIDEFLWRVENAAGLNVGPPAPGDQASFKLLLTAGDYTATMRLTNRCGLDTTLVRNFTINQAPVNPTVGAVLCTGPVTLDANPTDAPNLRYFWLSGDTTETIVVNEPQVTYVLVADSNNCQVIGQFLVSDLRPQFDLGPDLTICEDNNTPALDVGNPGMTYQWTINGAAASTISTQAVDVTTPGVFTYQVSVTDPVTTCTITEDKVYTVNVSPNFTFSGVNPTSCGTATGSVTVQLNASTPAGGPLYTYFISGPGGNVNGIDELAPSTITLPNLTAGTYSAVVQDQISGCTISATTGLTDITLTTGFTLVDPCAVTLRYTVSGGVAPYVLTFTNSTTLAVTGPSAPTTSPFITPALPAGPYSVQIKDNNNCTQVDNITVTPNPSPAVSFTPDLCARTLRAGTTGATGYTWQSNPPGQFLQPSPATDPGLINLTPNAGTVTYTVVATGAGICPATSSTTLNVGNIITPTLSQSDGCQSTVRVTANPPTSGVVYRWYRNGVLDVTLGGSQILLTTADHNVNFAAEIFDPQSGCTTPASAPLKAVVVGPIVATLTSTPPCNDNQPITLTVATTTPGVAYRWLLNNQAIPGATASSLTDTREGEYTVEITKAICLVDLKLQITRAPIPEGQLPNRVVICNDPDNNDPETKSIDLDPGPFDAYDWFINNLSIGYTQRVYTADSEGIYKVELTNSFDCKATDETDVRSECIPSIDAPNAFRPSSTIRNDLAPDLSNAEFWVLSRFIEDDGFLIFIFNRWGEMVYTSSDRNFKWNGGYNNNAGIPAPPGTYSYIIRFVSSFRPDLGQQEQRGGVALLR